MTERLFTQYNSSTIGMNGKFEWADNDDDDFEEDVGVDRYDDGNDVVYHGGCDGTHVVFVFPKEAEIINLDSAVEYV
ncbi:Hypothetical predicted protein [Octopus vulgaris]|uniref:Uncharacterized protein n=1 Tax=Octopus vulgaris TaxID=6645 RepID=A0AA36FCA7_OCTVU|nr:Hypothetical predicted protein [Octopus vulgaris]